LPIFAYQCPDCGHSFDALQKVGAEALSQCPDCSGHGLRKPLSAPNLNVKGTGWRKADADEKNKKPVKRPRFAHTFDSPVPHADHHDHSHGHGHSNSNKRTDDHKH